MLQSLSLILANFSFIILPVIIAAVIVKVILFLKFKTSNCSYYNLIYFRTGQIISSKTEVRINVKIWQNSLSCYVAFLVLLNVFVSILLTA